MHDVIPPKRDVSRDMTSFKFGKLSCNILLMVQDRNIIAMEH